MVRVLASGEIVADDDPRAQTTRRQQSGQARPMGQIRHDDDNAYQGQGQGGGAADGQGQGVSIFQVLNQKLLDAGIPRWNLGSMVIEPIVTIGFILAVLLLGMKGLFLGAILFAVVKLSSGDGNSTTGGGGSGSGGGRVGGGRGGRSGSGGRTTGGRVLGGR